MLLQRVFSLTLASKFGLFSTRSFAMPYLSARGNFQATHDASHFSLQRSTAPALSSPRRFLLPSWKSFTSSSFGDLMATFGLIEYNAASAEVRAVYDDIMATRALDPLTKEMIYIAVSVTNNCNYCIASHTASAFGKGMTDAMFKELQAIIGMANETNKLVSGYQVEVDQRFLSPLPR